MRARNDALPERISRGSTLTEQVYDIIKKRIINGGYPVGAHLVERQLAEEFHISKTPVREALARLEKERLVDFEPGRGMRVRSLDSEEVDDILDIRELMEGFAAEKAALLCSPAQIKTLEGILARTEALPLTEIEEYKTLDEEFHEILWTVSENGTLAHLMGLLRDQIRLVMATTITLPGRRSESVDEHRRILEAIKVRDSNAAGNLARQHMRNARQAVHARLNPSEGLGR